MSDENEIRVNEDPRDRERIWVVEVDGQELHVLLPRRALDVAFHVAGATLFSGEYLGMLEYYIHRYGSEKTIELYEEEMRASKGWHDQELLAKRVEGQWEDNYHPFLSKLRASVVNDIISTGVARHKEKYGWWRIIYAGKPTPPPYRATQLDPRGSTFVYAGKEFSNVLDKMWEARHGGERLAVS